MHRAMTILDILEATATRLPDKTAVIEEERRMSYGELMASARAVGCALSKLDGGGIF